MYKLKHQALCLKHQYTGSIYPYIAVPVDHNMTYYELKCLIEYQMSISVFHPHIPAMGMVQLIDDFFIDCDMDDIAFPDLDPFLVDDDGEGPYLYLNFVPSSPYSTELEEQYKQAKESRHPTFTFNGEVYLTKYAGHLIEYMRITT